LLVNIGDAYQTSRKDELILHIHEKTLDLIYYSTGILYKTNNNKNTSILIRKKYIRTYFNWNGKTAEQILTLT
jgi:hypothetical protein